VRLRCLIVDDNAGFLAAARDVLGRQEIDVVGVASSGREARERLGQLQPDVMLVDVDLGEESGFDLARELAESDHHAPPVVLISAYGEHDLADLIAASPALGFLSKAQLSGEAIRGLVDGAG
jgi:DNA-binding NarL/FixJ family response regulator